MSDAVQRVPGPTDTARVGSVRGALPTVVSSMQ